MPSSNIDRADSHYERLTGQAIDLLSRQPTVLVSMR